MSDFPNGLTVTGTLSVAGSEVPTLTSTSTLTNKTLTAPVLANPSYSGTTANGGTVTTIDINGGTIDGTVIGGTTPAAVSATTLSASGLASIGSGGTGTENGRLTIDGSSASSYGAYLQFKRNGVAKATIGTDSSINGGASDDLTLYTTSNTKLYGGGVNAATVSSTGLAVTGALSATGVLTSGQLNFNGAGTYEIVNRNGTGIDFYVNAASLKAMELTASGNLGLGVTPSAWSSYKAIQVGYSGAIFSNPAANELFVASNYYFGAGADRYIVNGFAANYRLLNGTHSWYTAPSGTAGNAITFTQAMTLDASGNLLVGVTADTNAPTTGVTLRNSSGTTGNIGIGHASGVTSGNPYANFAYDGTGIGSITQSGTTAVLYNTTSDARLKTNIAPAADAASLIDAIQVRQFDWLSDESHQRYGFVAQELYEVAPEAVSKPQDPDEMMAVDYSKLVPMLVKELQSLRARVTQLEGI